MKPGPWALAIAALASAGCDRGGALPAEATSEYREAVSAFYIGLAALQVGDDVQAESRHAELTRLAPGEPAGWANWGVLALRQRNYELAQQRFDRAQELAPKGTQIHYLAQVHYLKGVLERNRGNTAQAIAELRTAAERQPGNLRAAFALAEEIEREGGKDSDTRYQQAVERILAAQPDNLAAMLELARVAAKRGDGAALKPVLGKLRARSAQWPEEARQQLASLDDAASSTDLRAAATRTSFLRNVLMRVPEFRQGLAQLKAPPGEEAQPFTQLVRLKSPALRPAPADMALAFDPQPITTGGEGPWSWSGAVSMGTAGRPVVATANARQVRLASGATLPFPGNATPPSPEGVLALDFTYDFKTDLVVAGAGGVRLYRQDSPASFTDVTAKSSLPRPVLDAAYTGAWTVDIEADGDLDIVLGRDDADPVVLRNNGDGTFTAIQPFASVKGLRGFAWADLDGDGDPDAVAIDAAQRLHVFSNERQGQFRERALPATVGPVRAITTADADGDGLIDVIALKPDGAIVRICDRDEGQSWDVAEIARATGDALTGDVRLRVADLDNNGALDMILMPVGGAGAATARIWLGNEKGEWALVARNAELARVFDAVDLNADGKLDLIGLSSDGKALQALNRAPSRYHWQTVRPRAAKAVGDGRINPFGVGGEVEIRAGAVVQKQTITGPQLHFGLGEQPGAQVVRVHWPNGTVSAEFAVKADQEIVTEQRLKGSCPFLFAFNGKEMAFVKDGVPWGSAIGLNINLLGSISIVETAEWYKIRRDQLVARDGYYDIRVTGELWEVYYYDHFAMMTVDHPEGTEVFVDERFAVPAPRLAITTVETPRPIARATDDRGTDVTALAATLDGKAIDTFGKGQFQGVTRDHFLEVDLGDEAPASGPLYLIAHGSIRPTDSSVNVALAQGKLWQPRNLSFEVPDGRGGWVLARDNLGFPAGRLKTILFDLDGVFLPGTPRRIRIWTSLEIFWDKLEWARGLPDTPIKTTPLAASSADLHYRGYSSISVPDAGAPELPDYNRLTGTKQRWRDLIGYYTRMGEVKELLRDVDDRYVIMNSGDEISLRFPEVAPPAKGWVRDFVVMGDGWIKDGDYNSTHSKTVLPLPHHAERAYTALPGRLEDEVAYRKHPEDWQKYHTRYMTPDVFRNSLRETGRR